jgi:predicted nucleic acid-binding protein
MIALHAIAVGASLVTSDGAFSRIKSLKVEDSTKA